MRGFTTIELLHTVTQIMLRTTKCYCLEIIILIFNYKLCTGKQPKCLDPTHYVVARQIKDSSSKNVYLVIGRAYKNISTLAIQYFWAPPSFKKPQPPDWNKQPHYKNLISIIARVHNAGKKESMNIFIIYTAAVATWWRK